MALSEKEIKSIRKELESSDNPLFFFDDDPDGLCSFLQVYKFTGRGHGIIAKMHPVLGEPLLRKVVEYGPDKIFILDVPDVSQEFITGANVPVFWIDHHMPLEREGVNYFNPRKMDSADRMPVAYWCHKITETSIWIAMVGCVADWTLPDFREEFEREYPGLLPPEVDTPEKALFETKLGQLARIFSFILKGKTQEAMRCVRILTRIEDPNEILKQTTSRGAYIHKRYLQMKEEYDAIKSKAKVTDDELIVFTYTDNQTSFTSELSNELLYRHPDKVVIVAREKNGEMKCSIRSSKVVINKILEKVLEGLDGYGGGHEYACGACVKTGDWGTFLERLRQELRK